MDQPVEECDADAVLLIGDRAMRAALPGFRHSYDLGQEWTDWTGLPFVYAAWAVRSGVNLDGIDGSLQQSKRRGVENVAAIACQAAQELGLDAAFCRRYLTHIIRFDLGPAEKQGLSRFYELASELNLVPPGVSLGYYRQPESAIAAC
jgi:chorismate dehydratase